MSRKRNEILNPRKTGTDMKMDISDVCEEYAKVFGANKNIYRITPSLIDGLKPVYRRVLYALHINEKQGLKLYKVSRITGDTMGKFHPHGDGSIADVIGKMGQSWNWNTPLLTTGGSYGNLVGDKPAAQRYIEACLTDFSVECFFDNFDKSNVPMKPSYTGDDVEPEYLPSKYPVVLANPQLSGIGYGLASNLCSFNFTEVLEATIKLLHNPNAKIMLIPDIPTGCDVIDNGEFPQINKTGKGKVVLRARYSIDYTNNIISISSIPLQMGTGKIIENVIALHKNGTFPDLVDIHDSTKEGVVDLKLFLKSSANPDKIMAMLFKKNTGLKKTCSCEIRVIDDYDTHVYGTRVLLNKWNLYRRDCVRSIYNELIVTTMSDYHMNKVMILITERNNLDTTIDIVFHSKNKADAKEKLIKQYNITTLQADTIARMSMFSFTEDKREEYIATNIELKKNLKKYESILDSEDGVDKIIEQELREGIKKYGRERQSKIIKEGKSDVAIKDTMHIIGFSKDGYIKKISIDASRSIGSVGKTTSVCALSINNRDNLLIFDSSGKISRISVSALPDMEVKDIGVEINRYFKVEGSIVSAIRESDVKDDNGSNIVFVTKNGFGKKTSLSEFKKIKDCTISIALDENDELVSAIPSLETEDFIMYTNFGDGIRLSTKDFKTYKKTAKGLSLLSLKQNEEVVGIDVLDNKTKHLIYITTSGRMKRTELKYFPVMKRRDEAISLISLENNERLLGVNGVMKNDTVICYRKKSKPVEVKVSDIPVTSRVAKAEKIVKTPKGDSVVAYQICRD